MEKEKIHSVNYDEVDLYQLISIIWRRKNIAVITFLVSTILGTTIAFLLPNIYQARASVHLNVDLWKYYLEEVISSIPQNEKLSVIMQSDTKSSKTQELTQFLVSALNGYESRLRIARELKEKYGLDLNLSDRSALDRIYTVRLDKNGVNIVLISEMKDRKIAEATIKLLIEELDRKAKEFIYAYCRNAYKVCEEHYSIVFAEEPFSFDKPVKPKRGLIISASAISGLLLGIFLAFLWEGLARRRDELKAKSNLSM